MTVQNAGDVMEQLGGQLIAESPRRSIGQQFPRRSRWTVRHLETFLREHGNLDLIDEKPTAVCGTPQDQRDHGRLSSPLFFQSRSGVHESEAFLGIDAAILLHPPVDKLAGMFSRALPRSVAVLIPMSTLPIPLHA
ncbi:hypothetical protein [Streptomyces acidiscabies]|uniref:Uncharacterized protein n=1 Tax=Streptomyces acidiscabies TaxID=42234 RepID=A0AAP6EIY3_9ACTN|nr:hypothetical protein [Streptomyces acidiscabies]MBZ3916782.1 hypothetical protein [Streptomyces acidiscabies]MDX2964383.1 hypothetical protein [Streptomyces acidiscabies]MDX3022932.1 hypothetical protein [Streptomyces acidiscabies]MDX3794206.1 hypothetical protein [Streptomyces acidiscabies]